MNLRADNTFVEDNVWYIAADRYQAFIKRHKDLNIVYLELGVGGNTPGIIKYPFWQMTYNNPHATYICINLSESYIPTEIKNQSIGIAKDIGETLIYYSTLKTHEAKYRTTWKSHGCGQSEPNAF